MDPFDYTHGKHIEQRGLSDNSDFSKFFKNKVNVLIVAVCAVGLLLFATGAGLFLFSESKSDEDIKIISSADSSPGFSQIVVDIDGAVAKPGVYKLNANSRVNDAINSAGGLTDKADRSKINLAAKVTDGQKIYVAKVGESSTSTGSTKGTKSMESSGLVSINSASQAELEDLPGIGPVTAGKIIGNRPFSSPDELLSKKVVNKSTFEKIKDLISI